MKTRKNSKMSNMSSMSNMPNVNNVNKCQKHQTLTKTRLPNVFAYHHADTKNIQKTPPKCFRPPPCGQLKSLPNVRPYHHADS